MIPIHEVVFLSRLQFALTALYHFLFVPLTLGLTVMLAIMESVYVMTKKTIWRDMTKFWGILLGINFAMGVATGITMEFQFGTNWAYFSRYVGDIFGAPLAIEGLMAFFLEATFVGLFFFGWDRLSRVGHLTVTWLLALGTNFSAMWILIANGWMQHPVGAYFNFHTMRMEVKNFADVIFNPVAQAKFVHTISAGYITGAVFVLAISAYFLIRNRHQELAKRSMVIAASFGLAAALSVVVLGDESGYLTGVNQHMKIAAMESMWHTEKAPASFTLFGIPDMKQHKTLYAVHIPYMLGLIATRSFNTPLPGIDNLVTEAKGRIRDGLKAYSALKILEKNANDKAAQAELRRHQMNLGYALLLKRYTKDPLTANTAQINAAANSTIPNVPVLFWAFRIMVACGFFFILLFTTAFLLTSLRKFDKKWFLYAALFSLPLPWIAIELGWVVAEYGRQPWIIDGVLPTFLGTSSTNPTELFISLGGFILFYTVLAIVEMFLMVKYVKIGPSISPETKLELNHEGR